MGKKPDLGRIRERPDPSQWADDELLTLAEAAELMWPNGPLRTASLRTAARDGKLGIAEIAGKHMTTKAALRAMSNCSIRQAKPEGPPAPLSRKNILEHMATAAAGAAIPRPAARR